MEADTPGDDSAEAQQRSQIEHVRPDDDPGAQPLLMAGHRRDGCGDLRRIGGQRRDDAQQRLRQAQALPDPLKPGHQDPARCQADQRPGQEHCRHGRCRHPAHSPRRLASGCFPDPMTICAPGHIQAEMR